MKEMLSSELSNTFISSTVNVEATTPVIEQAKNHKKTKKTVSTCQICIEPFNKSNHISIKCPFCDYECCRSCCETYILNETVVKCMNPSCSKEWSRKHIRERFTLVFINGRLKDHREKVLFDKERALLPATQPIVEGKKEVEKIEHNIALLHIEWIKCKKRIDELVLEKDRIIRRKTRGEVRNFIRPCSDENCRGFLSTQWKCGICEKWTCPECHNIKGYNRDSEHVCNENDIATAKLLMSDTKPCPKCGTGIFKIDGCDQMWCTQCHTPFSWRTGNIEKTIHNPHYFEWMRRTGGELERNPLDVPCGRNLDHYLYESFARILRNRYDKSTNSRTILKRLDTIIRCAIHISRVEQPRQPNYEARNEALRVSYLMNNITETEMRILLQRDDKRYHRRAELTDVYQLLINTVTDILYRFLDSLQNGTKEPVPSMIDDSILSEIDKIVEYANECLADISYTYSCSKIAITNHLKVIRGNSINKDISSTSTSV